MYSIVALLLLVNIPSRSVLAGVPDAGFSIALTATATLELLLVVATVVVFLIWFYLARKNAGLSGWRQRRAPGWAIGSWFLPPVFFWFPYQIMADIWRAGRPPELRGGIRNAALPALWWTSWTLAWVTSFQHTTSTTHGPGGVFSTSSSYNLNFGGTWFSSIFAAGAAILLVLIIRQVSAGPVGHPALPGVPPAMPADRPQ
jgi:hypothetical protein